MPTPPDPGRDIARIRATITSLRGRIEGGERVDLAGLTRDVGALCEQLAAMPGEAARPHGPALTDVMNDLNDLEGLLRHLHDDLDQRVAALSDSGSTA